MWPSYLSCLGLFLHLRDIVVVQESAETEPSATNSSKANDGAEDEGLPGEGVSSNPRTQQYLHGEEKGRTYISVDPRFEGSGEERHVHHCVKTKNLSTSPNNELME